MLLCLGLSRIVLLCLWLLRHVHHPGGRYEADRDRDGDGLPLVMLLLQLLITLLWQLLLLQPWLSPDVRLVLLLLAMNNMGRSEITPCCEISLR